MNSSDSFTVSLPFWSEGNTVCFKPQLQRRPGLFWEWASSYLIPSVGFLLLVIALHIYNESIHFGKGILHYVCLGDM